MTLSSHSGPDFDVATVAFYRQGTEHSFEIELDTSLASHVFIRQALERGVLYEPVTSEIITRILKPGDTAVDAGAHIGYFALLAAACVGERGRVLAFEPEAENARRFKRNAARNGFETITLFETGLSDHIGRAQLSINADNDGGHALWDVGKHFANPDSRVRPQSREIDLTTLDTVLKGSVPKLIKIDVEGAELATIRGGAESIGTAKTPFVIAEINILALDFMDTSEAEVRHVMTEAGYTAFGLFDGQAMEGQPMAVTPLDPNTVYGHEGIYNVLFATADGIAELTAED